MNKTISHMHKFFKKIKLTHHYLNLHRPFIPAESIVWIFFIFRPSKIRVCPTGVVSSLFPPWCRLSFGQRRHTVTSCHTSFLLSQDELCLVASYLKSKLKHLICTPAVGYPPRTTQFSPSTAIKKLSQYWSLFSSLSCVSIFPHP
jgi:hypothetical protein